MNQEIFEFVQSIFEKVKQRKGWARFYNNTDWFNNAVICYGNHLIEKEKVREEILNIFSQDHMLDLFDKVEFLPPCILDGWILDVTPSKKFIEQYC